ncbi:pilus assembly protein [Tessaracoccus rhinocerotis]|uniref:Pilus assembly protein n=1 Tax=Tessaracoccus rhinocerotis TaxID=1689449 RepID=A0A553JXU2_9ACTN|nr:pilus assembly protein [Tessaracoccus rhinocerotis]TRY17252.1 pilus assembly protein [Tessaracoccus rhinocerotis]
MRRRDQRGMAVSIEAAVVIPALILFVGLVVILARDALAQQAVGAAAAQAARSASIERTVGEARAAAAATAEAALRDGNIECSQRAVTLDARALAAPLGAAARVSVTVTCTVAHDFGFPGFPSEHTIVQTRESPVDTYRGR